MGCNAPAPWLKAKDGQGTAGAAAIKKEEEAEAAAEEQEQDGDEDQEEGEGEAEKKVEVCAPLADAKTQKDPWSPDLCKRVSCGNLVGAESALLAWLRRLRR